MTLSKRQTEVIDLMGEGWHITYNKATHRYYIFNDYGNFWGYLHGLTFYAMHKKGLLKVNEDSDTLIIYELTDKAKGI